MSNKKQNHVIIRLPEETFAPNAEATRRSPLRMRYVRRIGELQQEKSADAFDALCIELAKIWPNWNLIDPETDEPLPQPCDEPQVFMELEVDQFQFFGGAGLVERPTFRRK